MASKVSVENTSGIKELDAFIQATSNKLGVDLSGTNYGNLEFFTTGSLVWDMWLRRGGLPQGRIIEVMGDESTMKTTFALLALAARQAWRKKNNIDMRDLLVDMEHTLTNDYLISLGVDPDLVIWVRPDTAEQALETLRTFPKSGFIDYAILDSVDSMQNEKQLRRSVGEVDVGGISKEMNFAIRDISKTCVKTNTTYIFINQIKMNPGQMFGSPEVTPGGRALQFYATLRIKMLRRKPGPLPNSTIMRGRMVKTKFCGDVPEDLEAVVVFNKGYDATYDLNTVATKLGCLRHSAGQTKVRWSVDSDWEPIDKDVDKGKDAGIQFIEDNPEVAQKLRETCFEFFEHQQRT